MTVGPENPEGAYHVIAVDNTMGLLARLRDDPFALASCEFHPGVGADMIFAAPEGVWHDEQARIVAYCGHHIIKGEGLGLFALLDQTEGYSTERNGYEPLLTRETLEDFEAIVGPLFMEDELRSLQLEANPTENKPEVSRIKAILKRIRQRYGFDRR